MPVWDIIALNWTRNSHIRPPLHEILKDLPKVFGIVDNILIVRYDADADFMTEY